MLFALLLVFVILSMRKELPFSALVINLTSKFFNLCSRFAASSACKMVNFNNIYFKHKLSNEWVASFQICQILISISYECVSCSRWSQVRYFSLWEPKNR